jgi:AmmeMemoRadiSam system protein B
MTDNVRPKLRRVRVSQGQMQGQPVVVLSEPLGLVDRAIAVPRDVAPLLELCDGSRDVPTLIAAFELRTGRRLPAGYVESMLSQLDEALLLDNQRCADEYSVAVELFRTAPSRAPALAGSAYPSNPEGLERTIDEYLAASTDGASDTLQVRGLISPHIDYARGASVYAGVWQRAAAATREADVAIVLGTNHNDCRKLFAMTRQSYSTPWGVLPTAVDVVDAVAAALGDEEVFAEELHHRNEHSVEAAVVWLHYLVRQAACQVLPVLCGSFQEFVGGVGNPGEDRRVAEFVEAVNGATAGRRVLVVAAADLAHVGPAFGDLPVDVAVKADVSAADGQLMEAMAGGDADGMFQLVKQVGDRWKVCGLAPMYLALRLLGDTTGQVTGYEQCPADYEGKSFVSICGMLFN